MPKLKSTATHYLLILLVAGLVIFTNLGGPRLWDRDEPRNAGCAAEMLAAGDWVVPVFNGELRDAKPVLLYWLVMSAYAVFGQNEFAARFWCALAGVGTVLATYHIGRRLFNGQVALWAAIILSTTLMFDVAARACTPDSPLIFVSTTSLLVFVCGTFRPGGSDETVEANELRVTGQYFPRRWTVAALMYGLMAVGILAKGPVGLVLPTAVIGMFLLIMRLPPDNRMPSHNASRLQRVARWISWLLRPFAPGHFLKTCWMMRPLTAITVALAVALPWYVWVGLRTDGAWPRGFFLEENLGRALKPMDNHGGLVFYYVPAIMIGFFPWSVFLGPVLVGAVRRFRNRHPWHVGYVFLLCWLGVYVGLFSLARTKLPSYVTPAYPALALLTAGFVFHFARGKSLAAPLWPRLGVTLAVVVGLGITVGVFFAAQRFLPGDEWLGGIGMILVAGGVACHLLMRMERLRAAGIAFAATAVAFNTALFGFASLRVDHHQQNHKLLDTIARQCEEPRIGALGCLEPSLVYYAQRPIRQLVQSVRPPSDSASKNFSVRTPLGRAKPRIDAAGFLRTGPDTFVITTDRHFRDLAGRLPRDVQVLAEVPYFLKKHRLLLLGRQRSMVRTAAASDAELRH